MTAPHESGPLPRTLYDECVERAATILMSGVIVGKMSMTPFSTEAARYLVGPIVTDMALQLHLSNQAAVNGRGGRKKK